MNYLEYLPFAVNLGFLGVGYWAGTRGPAKVWQDLTGDVADIKTKLESLDAKVAPTPKAAVTVPVPVSVAHPATVPAPAVPAATVA